MNEVTEMPKTGEGHQHADLLEAMACPDCKEHAEKQSQEGLSDKPCAVPVRLVIELLNDGKSISVQGAIVEDQIFCVGLLEMAKESVKRYHARKLAEKMIQDGQKALTAARQLAAMRNRQS
jgi:hypothetical protein